MRVSSRIALPALLGLTLALGACSSQPDDGKAPFISTQDYLQSAYRSPQHFKFDDIETRWAWDKHQTDISLLVPTGQKNLPVIIYLPGLGESSTGGELWRQTWADAGYAVLSAQSTTDNASIYETTNARDGAFRTIAQDAFSDAQARRRVAQVEQILAEARRRGQAGEAGFSALDTQRVAVAGFDLGAQTAAMLAGERQPGQPRASTWQPLAAIILSPYVPNGADPSRYGPIDTPVLAVTGPLDEDPFSWVANAQQRYAFFDGLTPNGYQLKLNDATHAVLSGNINKPKPDTKSRGPDDQALGGSAPHKPGNPGFDARQGGSVAAVTIAFLDAKLKQSAPAQQWLDQKAQAWLTPVGGLTHK